MVLFISLVGYFATTIIVDLATNSIEEQMEGQWLEVFRERPSQNQPYAIVYIHYDQLRDELIVGGYGYTDTGEANSNWNSNAAVIDEKKRALYYRYTGEIYNKAESIDGSGSIQFNPITNSSKLLTYGTGEFREEYFDYKKLEYEMIRITEEMTSRLIGKGKLEPSDYPDFIKAYHREVTQKETIYP